VGILPPSCFLRFPRARALLSPNPLLFPMMTPLNNPVMRSPPLQNDSLWQPSAISQ
jgi:hypothetical protein